MPDQKNSSGSTKKDCVQERLGHPSRDLGLRARGYGIGGGYERPYQKRTTPSHKPGEVYGPLPHSGYYGGGAETKRFKQGQAGFTSELSWYAHQYGEETSGTRQS